ncbi:MAG: hypothetical protein EOO82_02625, partial [Oxalobacteraceae bacterium]
MKQIANILGLIALIAGNRLEEDESHQVSESDDFSCQSSAIQLRGDFNSFIPLVHDATVRDGTRGDALTVDVRDATILWRTLERIVQELDHDQLMVS